LANRPFAFAEKVVGQLKVFYSMNCPAFRVQNTYLLSSAYAYRRSLAALSQPQFLQLLTKTEVGLAFLRRTRELCFTDVVIHQSKLARIGHIRFAQSYLLILLISVPLAAWSLFKRNDPQYLKWPAVLVVLLYFAVFANVFSISVVHSMEVDRYSSVLFIAALFAQLWAIRWLIETTLIKLREFKSPVTAT
jgi:hypothetical protein